MDLLGDMTGAAPHPAPAPLPSSLDLGDIFGDDTSSMGGASASGGMVMAQTSAMNVTTDSTLPKMTLLNHVTTRGLGVEYQFVRTMTSSDSNVIRLFFKNHSSMAIQSIKVSCNTFLQEWL